MHKVLFEYEAADYLGSTVEALRDQRRRNAAGYPGLLAFKVGRFWRYDLADLAAYIEAQKAQRPGAAT